MQQLCITPLCSDQRIGWERLFRAYADFYRVEIADDTVAQLWNWLLDSNHQTQCLLAVEGTTAVGLAHYRTYPSTLRGCECCFLDDLFVAPSARGRQIGAQLVQHLARLAQQQGWPLGRVNTSIRTHTGRCFFLHQGAWSMVYPGYSSEMQRRGRENNPGPEGCAPNDDILRCSSFIWGKPKSFLAPRLTPFGAAMWMRMDVFTRPNTLDHRRQQ